MWVKFGWSEYYRGDPVDGNFSYMSDGGEGHEGWNFEPGPDGRYYCYVPPQGAYAAKPSSEDPHGWTVVCLAKNPAHKGVHVVGWYEDATLEGRYVPRPGTEQTGVVAQDGWGEGLSYSISAPRAYLVPPEARTRPFSHPSVKQGKYSLLAGPGVLQTENKKQVLDLIERELRRVRKIAVLDPDQEAAPDVANDEVDPLALFGSVEHRRKVEKAAEEAVKGYFAERGYSPTDHTKANVGYDFDFTKAKEILHVEVKGTAAAEPRFFLTRNEFSFLSHPNWRLAIVTRTLSAEPDVALFDHRQFKATFDLEPLTYFGKLVPEVTND